MAARSWYPGGTAADGVKLVAQRLAAKIFFNYLNNKTAFNEV
jgi:hypothetical protein